MKPNLSVFLLQIVLLVLYLKTHCQTQIHKEFSMFSSRGFTPLYFAFRSIFHFKLLFVESVESVSKLIFPAMWRPCGFSTVCWKTILSQRISVAFFLLAISWLFSCGSFYCLYSAPLSSLSITFQYPLLWLLSPDVWEDLKSDNVNSLCFSPSISIQHSGLLPFFINFRADLLIFTI